METQNQHNNSFEKDNSIPKQNNFKIPEGYFEKLASQMEEELEIKNESPKKGVLRILAINISIAAAVVLGVFLFNPQKSIRLEEEVANIVIDVQDDDAIYVEEYMLAMVESTEEWQPLESFEIEVSLVSEEEVEAVDMPVVEEVTADDITDFFEDEDYYEL
ncbi:hypothetical protein [Parvicella tangerina]|uniref:Uncharacterized protein n=1 Tax=Parvicella tangerina TaxID=2829795 RepID=A0A916JQF2_9FLAO|nr:hypothetical protein [Parvicella tangerina]CAG5087629.1 hypothetical protein CRYO30217_03531 [Parvicella tangerina]